MSLPIRKLEALFGDHLQQNVRLSNYTTSRLGGKVEAFLPVNSLDELRRAAQHLWELDIPFRMMGSGANILVSDSGYSGVVLLNRCHNIKIHSQDDPPWVYAEGGANLGNMARQSALRGIGGLEWANSIPGSVGGAVYGNAGAHGSDVAATLINAVVMTKEEGEKPYTPEDMRYEYRSSFFKREVIPCVILSASFKAVKSTRDEAWATLNKYGEYRRKTQPPGNSTGSTFKNPPGDYAGRLIEAAGLKGHKIGGAEFSQMHANFIVNDGNASAQDYYQLIRLAQSEVKRQFGVDLQMEIEFLGDFND